MSGDIDHGSLCRYLLMSMKTSYVYNYDNCLGPVLPRVLSKLATRTRVRRALTFESNLMIS